MKHKITAGFLLIAFCLLPMLRVGAQTMPKDADPKLWAQALKIHKKAIVIDGHNDIPTPMVDEDFDLATSSVGKFHKDGDPFHTDLDRFKRSGITGEFFSIYVAASYATSGGSARRALDLIDVSYRAIEKYPDQLTFCTTAADIRRAKKTGKLCVLMGIEGGHAIEDSLSALREFYRLGVRYMTLTHNNTNNWADACCSEAKHGGLSDFGKEVVKEMNRLGMLVDISHVSDDTMNDVLDVSTAPVIYSHSSARVFSDHRRNVTDEILKRLAKNGGVVMVNFYPAFLDQRYRDESRQRDERLKSQIDALTAQYKNDREGLNEALRKLYTANPIYTPSYTRIVDHIDHIVKVAGIDYVGIGSDYDGVPLLPEGMNGAEDLVLVTYEMLKRGYSEKDIRKVLGENFLRAFEGAENVARIGSRKISGEGSLKKIK
ncbi:MAG TPA: dipeptidase [Pyrinomonadaceae bacterium]|nr:dipeptidase [Pyrinomonadaceae bacterium]